MNYLTNKRYKCEICGRELFKKNKVYGHNLCSKHMHQFHKYGKFLDNIMRTNQDLNDYEIIGNLVYFNVYKQDNTFAERFVIDLADIEKVKYKKWRMNHGHVVTGSATTEKRDLSHIILDVKPQGINSFVVDHIDGNPLNNRRANLRVVSQAKNTLNKARSSTNTSGFIGVFFDKSRNSWAPEISMGYTRIHLGRYKEKSEAIYARYVAEEILFQEMCNEKEHTKKEEAIIELSTERKEQIKTYIINKINSKLLREN